MCIRDRGYRAWQRGWPTVFVAGAMVEHRHRATTRRYYTEEQLEAVLEVNYLKFVARSVARRALFGRLWKQALDRLRLRVARRAARPAAQAALRKAAGIARSGGPASQPAYAEEVFLALTGGSVALFPGRAKEARACIPVSYTHLDVYKRQSSYHFGSSLAPARTSSATTS